MAAFIQAARAACPLRALAAAALCAALLLSGPGRARAASTNPQWQAGQFGITVWPSIGPVYLCIGETFKGWARVDAYPKGALIGTRLPWSNRSTLSGALTNPIGSLSVAPGPVMSGAAAYIPWSFTASKLGDTRITFSAQVRVDNQTYPVRGPYVDVKVTCAFKLNVVSEWILPGQREHFSLSAITDVIMAPDPATGLYRTDATSNNETRPFGACTGSASVTDSQAHFEGRLTSSRPPKIPVQVTYTRATAQSAEGCKGKGHSGWGMPDPLSFTVEYGLLQWGSYTISLPQNLQTDAGSIPGHATITVEP